MAYEAVTHSIAVRADPCYMKRESDPANGQYVWAYTIEIANGSDEAVQLLSRHWRILDATGLAQEVRGPGVIGQQPVIQPGETFRYTSWCPLNTPAGMMAGRYQMIRVRSGEAFEIDIPAFALDGPEDERRVN